MARKKKESSSTKPLPKQRREKQSGAATTDITIDPNPERLGSIEAGDAQILPFPSLGSRFQRATTTSQNEFVTNALKMVTLQANAPSLRRNCREVEQKSSSPTASDISSSTRKRQIRSSSLLVPSAIESPSLMTKMPPAITPNSYLWNDNSNSTSTSNSTQGSRIEFSLEYVLQLQALVFPEAVLLEKGYIMTQFSEEKLNRKKRCKVCGQAMSKRQPRSKGEGKNVQSDSDKSTVVQQPHPEVATTQVREPFLRCKFHEGMVVSKVWTCCNNHVSSPPCSGNEHHKPQEYPEGELERRWKFYPTPDSQRRSNVREAVAMDCEMGTAQSGDSELIRVTLVDYFSSEVLIDSLVYPDVKMQHYNTRFSGVTRKDMIDSLKKGRCLMGRDMARRAVWSFVGPETVVVGHSPNNDLTALRWIHPNVVDTFLLESARRKAEQAPSMHCEDGKELSATPAADLHQASQGSSNDKKSLPKRPKGTGPKSLKTLAKLRLGRDIQVSGKKGHDSLEDAIASRDLAHWAITNRDFERRGT